MAPKLRIRTSVKQHLHINVWLIQGWMRRGIQRKLEQTDQTKYTYTGTYMWKVNTKEISQKLIETLNQCV